MSELFRNLDQKAIELGIDCYGEMFDAPTSYGRHDFETGGVSMRRPGTGEEVYGNRPYQFGDAAKIIDWRATARQPDESLIVKQFEVDKMPHVVAMLDAGLHLYPEQTLDAARKLAPLIGNLIKKQEARVTLVSPVMEDFAQSFRGKRAPSDIQDELTKIVINQALLWKDIEHNRQKLLPQSTELLQDEIVRAGWPDIVIYGGSVGSVFKSESDIRELGRASYVYLASSISDVNYINGVRAATDSQNNNALVTDEMIRSKFFARNDQKERVARKLISAAVRDKLILL